MSAHRNNSSELSLNYPLLPEQNSLEYGRMGPAARRIPSAWMYPRLFPNGSIPPMSPFVHNEYVLDGSNITCLAGEDRPDLADFLNVAVLALRRTRAVAAFFDSNAGDILEEHRPDQAPAYFELINAFRDWFKQVRPRTRADESVLAGADGHRGIVISNDTFRKPSWYAKCFPWIMHPSRRLEVHRACTNRLRIGSHLCVVRRSLPELMGELRALLSKRRSELRLAG